MSRNRITMTVKDEQAQKSLATLLAKLPEKIRHKPLLEGARIIAKAARKTNEFTDRSGKLRASIRAERQKRRAAKYARTFHFVALASAGGYGKRRGLTPYAHLVEYGHQGKRPAEPRPFMKRASEKTLDAVIDAVHKGIRREFARLNLR